MKNFILIFCFLLLSFVSNAQIEKGTLLPGAQINIRFSGQNNKDSSQTKTSNSNQGFGFTLSHGRFIKDNLLFLIAVNYTNSAYKYSQNVSKLNGYINEQSNSTNTSEIVFDLRKYKFISPELAFYYGSSITLGFQESLQKNKFPNPISDPNTGAIVYISQQTSTYTNYILGGINLNTGFQYFLTKNIALLANINFFNLKYFYSLSANSKKGTDTKLEFTALPSFNNFGLGVNYFIRPNAKK